MKPDPSQGIPNQLQSTPQTGKLIAIEDPDDSQPGQAQGTLDHPLQSTSQDLISFENTEDSQPIRPGPAPGTPNPLQQSTQGVEDYDLMKAGLSRGTFTPDSDKRVVVILGKVGSGKRTLGNHLVGQKIFDTALDGTDKMTRNATVFYAESPDYRIMIIDTESLQMGYINPIEHMMQKFQAINLIIFTIPYGLYTDESHESLMHVLDNLQPRTKQISALVFTHCEGIDENDRKRIKDEFSSSQPQVTDFMKQGIHAVGFPDTATVLPIVKPIYECGIAEDAEKIKRLVGECKASFPVSNLANVDQRKFSTCRPLTKEMPTCRPS